MYTSYMKNVLNLVDEVKQSFASAILSLGKHCFLPLIANEIKNNIISSIMHIIVCLPKTE